jgi:hypothetical protein
MTYGTKHSSQLVKRSEAAKFLGVAPQTLAVWACTKRYALPYVKVGRLVKYRLVDLENFIASRTVGMEVAQ